MLLVAMECFKNECDVDGLIFPQSKEGSKKFLTLFLKQKNIELWYTFRREEPSFFDDLSAYGANVISRVLLDICIKYAIREGDAMFINTYHRIMVLYMLNSRDSQVSMF